MHAISGNYSFHPGCNISRRIKIEIVTIAFLYPTLFGGWPYIGPAFDVAFEDIRTNYPNLNVSHHVISDRRIRNCEDLEMENDNAAALHFYKRREKSEQPDLVVFIQAG